MHVLRAAGRVVVCPCARTVSQAGRCRLRCGASSHSSAEVWSHYALLSDARSKRSLSYSGRVLCTADVEVKESASTPAAEALPVAALDIRVGRILEVSKHPDADSLYVESVDVGEEEPRTIISGLVAYVPLEAMRDRSVIVLCNLKPRNMRGVKSHGMLMCASDAAHENVEPLSAPSGAAVGERIFFGEGGESQPEAESPNKVQKKKIWEELQPKLKTNADKVAGFEGVPMLTAAGPVTAATLAGANIS